MDLTNDALLFRCATLAATVSEAEVTAAQFGSNQSVTAPDLDAAFAFNLSSRPTAVRKLILDFKGGVVTGTAWNKNYPNITIPPYSKDGDTSTFSQSELQDIVAIWRAVSEDFLAYDVDVTTIIPPADVWVPAQRVMIGGDGSW